MGEIVWESDFMNALETAKNSNKLLFVAFSSSSCNACAKMDSVTFAEERVQEYLNSHFIPIKYKSSTNPEKYLRFRVTDTPTYIVLNLNGKEIKRMTGFLSSDDLIGQLDSTRSVS